MEIVGGRKAEGRRRSSAESGGGTNREFTADLRESEVDRHCGEWRFAYGGESMRESIVRRFVAAFVVRTASVPRIVDVRADIRGAVLDRRTSQRSRKDDGRTEIASNDT